MDDSRQVWALKYRIACLRSTLELVGVALGGDSFSQAYQEALKERVAASLESDDLESDPNRTL